MKLLKPWSLTVSASKARRSRFEGLTTTIPHLGAEEAAVAAELQVVVEVPTTQVCIPLMAEVQKLMIVFS